MKKIIFNSIQLSNINLISTSVHASFQFHLIIIFLSIENNIKNWVKKWRRQRRIHTLIWKMKIKNNCWEWKATLIRGHQIKYKGHKHKVAVSYYFHRHQFLLNNKITELMAATEQKSKLQLLEKEHLYTGIPWIAPKIKRDKYGMYRKSVRGGLPSREKKEDKWSESREDLGMEHKFDFMSWVFFAIDLNPRRCLHPCDDVPLHHC